MLLENNFDTKSHMTEHAGHPQCDIISNKYNSLVTAEYVQFHKACNQSISVHLASTIVISFKDRTTKTSSMGGFV